MSYSRIVVPLDGSVLAERALPLATALARQCGASLILGTVVSESVETSLARIQETASARAAGGGGRGIGARDRAGAEATAGATASASGAKYLSGVAEGLAPDAPALTCHTLSGDPASRILSLARRQNADLIVMATRGRSGLVRGLLGSVTDRVVLASEVPVLVVRSENAPGNVPAAAALGCVIVPLDGSELAETALPHACTLAEAFDGRIELMRAVPEDPAGEERVVAWQYLESVAGWLRTDGMRATTEVADGDPRAEIVARCEREDGSVVVMATRGATGFTRWQRGSVADGVVRTAPAPTMIVPRATGLLGRSIH